MKRILLYLLIALLALSPVTDAAQISRLKSAEISNGNIINSDDIEAELDNFVSAHNTIDTILDDVVNNTKTLAGVKTFSSTPLLNAINERTAGSGITLDDSAGTGVLVKDGTVKLGAAPLTTGGTIGYSSNRLKYYNGTSTITIPDVSMVGAVTARSSNTILAAADNGTLFVCTSTFTQTLTAAATLGAGWQAHIRNAGTGIITIDANASETTDGQTTIAVYPGESFTLTTDGSNFFTIGRAKRVTINSQSASASTSIDFTTGFADPEIKEYHLKIIDMVCATDGKAVLLRFSQAASFTGGAGEYRWNLAGIQATAVGAVGSASDTAINLTYATGATNGLGNAAGEFGSWDITILNPAGTALQKQVNITGQYNRALDGDNMGMTGYGRLIKNTTAIDGARIIMDSGNITSGTFILEGVRN